MHGGVLAGYRNLAKLGATLAELRQGLAEAAEEVEDPDRQAQLFETQGYMLFTFPGALDEGLAAALKALTDLVNDGVSFAAAVDELAAWVDQGLSARVDNVIHLADRIRELFRRWREEQENPPPPGRPSLAGQRVPRGQGGPGRLLRLHEHIGRDFNPDMVEPPSPQEQLADLIRDLPPLEADMTAEDIAELDNDAERIGYFRQYVAAHGVDELVPLVEQRWPDMAIELFDADTFKAALAPAFETMQPLTYMALLSDRGSTLFFGGDDARRVAVAREYVARCEALGDRGDFDALAGMVLCVPPYLPIRAAV
jgi:hypothetical protein